MIFSAFAQGARNARPPVSTSRPYCANLGAPREYSPKRAKAGDPMTEYYIPTQAGEAELVEKRSRFIGHVWRVESEEEARARIEEMKSGTTTPGTTAGATCCGRGRCATRTTGSPRGRQASPCSMCSSGRRSPTSAVWSPGILGASFWGAGGLVRAYTQSAKDALDAAGISVVRRWVETLVPCPYSLLERLKSGPPPGAA